jgi:hypothetical protein
MATKKKRSTIKSRKEEIRAVSKRRQRFEFQSDVSADIGKALSGFKEGIESGGGGAGILKRISRVAKKGKKAKQALRKSKAEQADIAREKVAKARKKASAANKARIAQREGKKLTPAQKRAADKLNAQIKRAKATTPGKPASFKPKHGGFKSAAEQQKSKDNIKALRARSKASVKANVAERKALGKRLESQTKAEQLRIQGLRARSKASVKKNVAEREALKKATRSPLLKSGEKFTDSPLAAAERAQKAKSKKLSNILGPGSRKEFRDPGNKVFILKDGKIVEASRKDAKKQLSKDFDKLNKDLSPPKITAAQRRRLEGGGTGPSPSTFGLTGRKINLGTKRPKSTQVTVERNVIRKGKASKVKETIKSFRKDDIAKARQARGKIISDRAKGRAKRLADARKAETAKQKRLVRENTQLKKEQEAGAKALRESLAKSKKTKGPVNPAFLRTEDQNLQRKLDVLKKAGRDPGLRPKPKGVLKRANAAKKKNLARANAIIKAKRKVANKAVQKRKKDLSGLTKEDKIRSKQFGQAVRGEKVTGPKVGPRTRASDARSLAGRSKIPKAKSAADKARALKSQKEFNRAKIGGKVNPVRIPRITDKVLRESGIDPKKLKGGGVSTTGSKRKGRRGRARRKGPTFR